MRAGLITVLVLSRTVMSSGAELLVGEVRWSAVYRHLVILYAPAGDEFAVVGEGLDETEAAEMLAEETRWVAKLNTA